MSGRTLPGGSPQVTLARFSNRLTKIFAEVKRLPDT